MNISIYINSLSYNFISLKSSDILSTYPDKALIYAENSKYNFL